MKIVRLLICIFMCGVLSSCGDDEVKPITPEVLDYFVVASRKKTIVDSNTNQAIECFIVRYSDKMEWFTLKTDSIKSFDYEVGFEYKIEVRTIDLNEGKDIPLYVYEVVKVMSKEKKETEGLPEDF